MVVIKALMYPQGHKSGAYTLGIASLTCLAQARRDDPTLNVTSGERVYDVKLFKAPEFNGPTEEPEGSIWKRGVIRGHQPTYRGVWDLLGGSLKQILRSRIDKYREVSDFNSDFVYTQSILAEMASRPDCPEEWRAWFAESAKAMEGK